MCGRFTQTQTREEVLEQLAEIELPPLFHGRYNIAPTQPVAAIRQQAPNRAEEFIWGFEANTLVINARSETLAERPMFRDLLDTNRCLIPADGFYEWKGRQPYYFQLPEKTLFAFAGLWRDGRCVVITRAADRNMQGIHDRMPVIIPQERWETWLLPPKNAISKSTAVDLDMAFPPPSLTARPVSMRVNKVANDDPSCLEPGEVQGELF